MGELVCDQIANQAIKPLKKGEKEKMIIRKIKKLIIHQFWNSRIAGSVVLLLL
jgi:hypothetical protein